MRVTTGVILALLLFLGIGPVQFNVLGLGPAGCISFPGVMWIGLLYYFNVVQIPGLAVAAAEQGRARRRRHQQVHRAAALLWFSLGGTGHLADRCMVPRQETLAVPFTLGNLGQDAYGLTIGIGAWLGTIMLFNVWVLIWPNQKKILGIVARHRRGKGQGPPGRDAGLPDQLRAFHPHAGLHGGRGTRGYFRFRALSFAPPDISEQVTRALAEDVWPRRCHRGAGPGCGARARHADHTSGHDACADQPGCAKPFASTTPDISIDWRAADGDTLLADSQICEIRGPARAILTGERCALNFLQTLSGTATETRRYVRGSGRNRLPDSRYAQDQYPA